MPIKKHTTWNLAYHEPENATKTNVKLPEPVHR
jgi:hypothetical protein